MPSLENQLHDEIDALETQRETVRTKVKAIKAAMENLAGRVRDIREIFEAAAILFENDIADDTTRAVQEGYALTKKQQNGQAGRAGKNQKG